MQCILTFRSNV